MHDLHMCNYNGRLRMISVSRNKQGLRSHGDIWQAANDQREQRSKEQGFFKTFFNKKAIDIVMGTEHAHAYVPPTRMV